MWYRLGTIILKNRILLLIILLLSTLYMGWVASKIQLSYEFSKAIPTDHPAYLEYQSFRQQFGEEGNLLLLGVQTDQMFKLPFFKSFQAWQKSLKEVRGVEDVWSAASAVQLLKDTIAEKFNAMPVFPDTISTQADLDLAAGRFRNIPFYMISFTGLTAWSI
jgi:hypothetical protein